MKKRNYSTDVYVVNSSMFIARFIAKLAIPTEYANIVNSLWLPLLVMFVYLYTPVLFCSVGYYVTG